MTLLIYYVTRILHRVGAVPEVSTRVENIRRVVSGYLGSGAFYRAAFEHEAGLPEAAEKVLEMLYEAWRSCAGEAVKAKVAWADWLRMHGQGTRAAEIIAGTGVQ